MSLFIIILDSYPSSRMVSRVSSQTGWNSENEERVKHKYYLLLDVGQKLKQPIKRHFLSFDLTCSTNLYLYDLMVFSSTVLSRQFQWPFVTMNTGKSVYRRQQLLLQSFLIEEFVFYNLNCRTYTIIYQIMYNNLNFLHKKERIIVF